jgi:hypothetical protein
MCKPFPQMGYQRIGPGLAEVNIRVGSKNLYFEQRPIQGSFVAQGDHGVDGGGAARRNKAGK